MVLTQSFVDMCRAVKNLSHPWCTFPTEMKQDDALSSCISSHMINKFFFTDYLVILFLCVHFYALCWFFHCLKWSPDILLVLSSVLRFRKAMMYFMQKMHVLDKLYSDLNSSAAGPELNVIASTIYIK